MTSTVTTLVKYQVNEWDICSLVSRPLPPSSFDQLWYIRAEGKVWEHLSREYTEGEGVSN